MRTALAVTAAVACVVVAGIGIAVAGQNTSGPVDGRVMDLAGDVWLDPGIGLHLADLAFNPLSVVLIAAALAWYCHRRGLSRLAVLAVVGPGLTGVLTTGLKVLVGRTIHGPNLSYPSGHTAAAATVALVLALLVVHRGRLAAGPAYLLVSGFAVLLGGAQAVVQVLMSSHYLSDTIGGFAVAVAVTVGAGLAIDAYVSRRRRHEVSTAP